MAPSVLTLASTETVFITHTGSSISAAAKPPPLSFSPLSPLSNPSWATPRRPYPLHVPHLRHDLRRHPPLCHRRDPQNAVVLAALQNPLTVAPLRGTAEAAGVQEEEKEEGEQDLEREGEQDREKERERLEERESEGKEEPEEEPETESEGEPRPRPGFTIAVAKRKRNEGNPP